MQSMIHRSRIISLLFIFLVIFAGCSRTSLIYKFSDWFIVNKIDDYFDLKSPQEEMLRKDAANLMVWHRKEELPRLATSLVELQARFRDGLSRDDIEWITAEHRGFWKRFLTQGIAPFAIFLTSVDEDQVRHLIVAMAKKNEFLDEQLLMGDEELLSDTMDWFYEMVEDWVGSLSDDQKKSINAKIMADHEWVKIKLKSRKWIQKSFADLINSGKSQYEIEEALRLWVVHPETTGTSEYRKRWDKRKILWHDILTKIDRRLTPNQRDHALDKLQDYIDDFQGLAENQG